MNGTDPATGPVPFGQRGPAAEILRLIRQRGPQDVKSLEAELGVSENAVREQLQHLLAAGLITRSPVRRGAGRPAHVYVLSDRAQGIMPQAYDVLLSVLLTEIAERDGGASAQQLLEAVGERIAEDITGGRQSEDLREQLQTVAAALEMRGMPITIYEHDDAVTLHEWSCPYYKVARGHRGVCEMEQHMLERALGAKVTIAERIIDGHPACTFRIDQS
jgi:predicted ArsR family transcriptional regulator